MIVKIPTFFEIEVSSKVSEGRLGAALDTELTNLVEEIFFSRGESPELIRNTLHLTAAKICLRLNLPRNSIKIVPKSKIEVLRSLTVKK